MGLTQIGFLSAAAEVRVAQAVLAATVAELLDNSVWEGPDALRFQQEWADLVSARLESAAARIETCRLIPLP
jgi:hypothetical protein